MSTKLTTNITEGMIHFLNCLTECCHVSLLSTGPSFPIRQGDFLVTSGVVKIFLLRIMHVLTTVSGKLKRTTVTNRIEHGVWCKQVDGGAGDTRRSARHLQDWGTMHTARSQHPLRKRGSDKKRGPEE